MTKKLFIIPIDSSTVEKKKHIFDKMSCKRTSSFSI